MNEYVGVLDPARRADGYPFMISRHTPVHVDGNVSAGVLPPEGPVEPHRSRDDGTIALVHEANGETIGLAETHLRRIDFDQKKRGIRRQGGRAEDPLIA
jgi:hypothetical protein